MSINLQTTISGIRLKNPTMLASGVLGVTKASLINVAKNGGGAVVSKSISKNPRQGHPAPIITTYEAGMLNAVGYSNPGALKAKEEFANIDQIGSPAILSIIGQEVEDFVEVWETLKNCGFKAIEVPLSCPHTPGYGTMGGQHTPAMAEKITRALKQAADVPVIIKVSPNENMVTVARAAVEAGADAITAVNTMGPGMIINIDVHKPILGFGMGGVSGAALRPVAVRCVFDLYKAVKIPIIGCGGVTTGQDMIEMMMAGAMAVQIGTAIYSRTVQAFKLIADEATDWLNKQGYKKITDIIGLAHR